MAPTSRIGQGPGTGAPQLIEGAIDLLVDGRHEIALGDALVGETALGRQLLPFVREAFGERTHLELGLQERMVDRLKFRRYALDGAPKPRVPPDGAGRADPPSRPPSSAVS